MKNLAAEARFLIVAIAFAALVLLTGLNTHSHRAYDDVPCHIGQC